MAGTPPQNFTVVSTLAASREKFRKKFNSAASSTFYDYHQSSTENFGTGVGINPSFDVVGCLGYRIAIAGLSATKTDFYLIIQQSAGFNADPFDDIFGSADGTMFQNLVN
ncbi:unnamed protein product [Rhizoctonia solani]|uniref:Uncharacterized protein n=1 Tax=Rhizoctonia solani TaxID=456999 RepID=A0A8H3E7D3_9AGAM|nr:unnamed protein product [Rhizoctonia solani]